MANEKRLIDAEKARKVSQRIYTDPVLVYAILNTLNNTPTVDAVEVAHGQWEDFCRGKMCCCSVCKAEFDNTCNEIHDEWHYCPNCGANMKGE